MLTIQDVGTEVLGNNPRNFYIFGGTEYGIDVKPYPEDLKSSINFYAYELKQAYNTIDDIVFVFTFDTVKDDFMSQRHKLYLTKLTTFSEIIV